MFKRLSPALPIDDVLTDDFEIAESYLLKRFKKLQDRCLQLWKMWTAVHWPVTLSLLTLAGVLAWGFCVEPDQLITKEVSLQIDQWPALAKPLKIAVLSDIHVGAPFIDLKKLEQVVEKTNAARPDLIVLLGDYVVHGVLGGRFVEPEQFAPVMSRFKAPMGVYAVLGNHDWWYDGFRTMRAFEKAGIRVLEDEVVQIPHGGQTLWLAGLGDYWTRRSNIEKTLQDVPEDGALIVLTHSPNLFPQIPAKAALTLAGHTHGGQVRIPFIDKPFLPFQWKKSVLAGHVQEGPRHIFVTPGIGTGGVPMRLRVPPEISLLTVRPGPAAPPRHFLLARSAAPGQLEVMRSLLRKSGEWPAGRALDVLRLLPDSFYRGLRIAVSVGSLGMMDSAGDLLLR